jgi:dTDP-4-amino-4,6-dideoxygalactose transaminase
MNHGEMRGGILGLNLRMTEITAAMAREQLKKAPGIMKRRMEIGNWLSDTVVDLGLSIVWPATRSGCTHSFYCWAGWLEKEPKMALPAPFRRGYMRPLYTLPAFASKQSLPLPVVESVEKNIVLLEVCSIDPTDEEIRTMVQELGKAL